MLPRGLFYDLKLSVRTLSKHAGVSCYVLAILALAIGANTAIFSVVRAALFERIPWPDSERIVSIRGTNPKKEISDGPISTADYLEWRDQLDALELTTGFTFKYFNITGTDRPERVEGFEIDGRFLAIAGVEPLLGRNFTDRDTEPGNDREAILTYKLWQRRFGGDANIVGQKVTIEGVPHVIVGVLPSRFWVFKVLNHDIDLLVPLTIDLSRRSHGSYDLNVFGKLKPNVTVEQAQARLSSIYLDLETRYPESNAGSSVRLVPIREWNESIRSILILLLASASFVLIIASANVANLKLAMANSRFQELAIHQAVGAGRLRLWRLLATESLVLSVTAGALSLLVASVCLSFLNRAIPYTLVRRVDAFQLDIRVLMFALGASVIMGLAFGVVPAIVSQRIDLATALKDASYRANSWSRRPIAELLVAVEVGLTVVLLAGAGMVVRGGMRWQLLDRGMNTRNLLVMQVWLPQAKYPEPWQVSVFYDQALRRIASLPGVQSASAVNFMPLDIVSDEVDFNVAGPSVGRGEEMRAEYKIVDSLYFRTLGIPLVEGRYFAESDADERRGVVIISESLARSLWPDESPIGKSLLLKFAHRSDLYWIPESRNLPLSVVGVVGDINKEGLPGVHPGELYLPYKQNPSRFMHLIVRAPPDPLNLAWAVSDQISSLDGDEAIFDVRTMDDVVSRSFSQSRISSILFSSFGTLALVIASLGVYGIVSYTITRQRGEIGIRIALGAGRRNIVGAAIGRTMLVSALGILMGLLGTVVAARILTASIFGVVPGGGSMPFLVAVLVGLTSLLAACLAARRALNVDPVKLIRCE